MKKTIYIIAGPNGAGKTTFALSSLKSVFGINEFVNADEIAKGISPLNPESANISAGKIMLERIKKLVKDNKNFAFETTLAGKNYVKYIKDAKKDGYNIVLIFLWLDSYKTATQRVARRVKEGGHNVPENVIKNRYISGLRNLFTIYENLVDYIQLIDNNIYSEDPLANIIAEKALNSDFMVYNKDSWKKAKKYE